MRQFIIQFEPSAHDEHSFDFTVIRHGEKIAIFTETLIPGMDLVKKMILENYAEDPL